MSSLIDEFQNDITSGKKTVTELLRMAQRIAVKLNLPSVEEWIIHELEGYKTAPEDVPDYRLMTGTLMAHNPYQGWILVAGESLPSWKDGQSIAVLEDCGR